jgi:outer membrane protein assembly factor BamB
MRSITMVIAAGSCLMGNVHAQPVPSQVEWTSLGGDEARTGTRSGWAASPLSAFTPPRWTLSQTALGQTIRFVGPAGVAASVLPTPRLFAAATVAGQTVAMAINAENGQIAWTTPLPNRIFDSWSSPALDPATGVTLYATGSALIALRMLDGTEAWRTTLAGPPVNVSPLVTRDLGLRNRAFITDDGGFGGPSSLYCINVSPRHSTLNPFDPGEVVWAAPIGSSTGGTPTYLDGIVYVCSTGLDGAGFGEIRAFDARSTAANPAPRWVFTNPIMEGFFGGLTIREAPEGPFLYAATYAFSGGLDSSNMVKVSARTGALVWSVACNRTDSIPILVGDGRIVLAGGIQGFGSVPMVQMFQDNGASATPLWNTATATWNDANSNGILDLGEFFLVGGWTTHPVLTRAGTPGATPRLLVGAIPTGSDFYGPYTNLYELDLSKSPAEPGFIVQQTAGAGSTPALLGAGTYSVGTAGLSAFGPPPPRPDVDGNGRIDIDDLYAWEQGQGFRDIDRSGVIDAADRDLLLFELRRNESRDMAAGRR